MNQSGVGRSDTKTRIELSMSLRRFNLPPVGSALVIGKRAGIGPNAMNKALSEMIPDAFTLLPVEHPIAEAVIVRNSHLRTVPADKLIPLLLDRCEPLMDESDMIHISLDIVVQTSADVEL